MEQATFLRGTEARASWGSLQGGTTNHQGLLLLERHCKGLDWLTNEQSSFTTMLVFCENNKYGKFLFVALSLRSGALKSPIPLQ